MKYIHSQQEMKVPEGGTYTKHPQSQHQIMRTRQLCTGGFATAKSEYTGH